MARGTGLGSLLEILNQLLEVDVIKRRYNGQAVGLLLRSYLTLKQLVAIRTQAIDRAKTSILTLLDALAGTSENERRDLALVCIATLAGLPKEDLKSAAIICERLCDIIHPEQKTKEDFLIIIEKDPQQEEFLQGRMLGNPYRSSDQTIGSLMRDLKNKICHDCELIALLEDENSMELLVRNNIINLSCCYSFY